MIKELIINRFGRFTGRSFRLAGVTVFLGENESGKTTLFDALFYSLCHPRASKRDGKLLKERYGDNLDVQLDPQASENFFDEDEFLNLYAIRSGDIELNLTADAGWMEQVKSRLFTGGIDPMKLRQHFENQASEKGSLKHNKELSQLQKESAGLQEKQTALQEKRNSLLGQGRDRDRMKTELSALQTRIAAKTAELTQLEKELTQQTKAKERAGFISIQSKLGQAADRSRRLSELAAFRQPATAELDRLQQQLQERSRELDLTQQKQALAGESLRELTEKIQQEQLQLKKQQQTASRAAECLNGIHTFTASQPRKKVTVWNRLLLSLALLPVTAACLLIFVVNSPLLRLVLPLAGVLIALILVLLARKVTIVDDTAAVSAFLQQLKDDWLNRGHPPLQAVTLHGIIDELQGYRRKADSTAEQLQAREEAKLRQQQAANRLQQEITGLQTIAQQAAGAVTAWLAERGVRSRDEYLARLSECKALAEAGQQWQQELKEFMHSHQYQDAAAFTAYLESRLKELAATELPVQPPADIALKRQEAARDKLRQELDSLKQQQSILNTKTAQASGLLSGSLDSLAGELVATEQKLQKNRSREALLLRQRKAAGLARDIFDAIARDSESVMTELSRELSGQFGKIIPELREVEIPELNTGAIRIADKGGVKRDLHHLSRGTRDAFLLAARLTLAGKAGSENGSGLVILDEPFYALDRGRILGFLELLSQFHNQTGWQLILLTKDEQLAAAMQDKFGKLMLHRLQAGS